jgi:SAM-dependent methyltransferase
MSEQATSMTPERQDGQDPEFGRHYFRHNCGVPYERNSHWLQFFDEMAETIVRDLKPTSVLDAGCAMGFLVEALRKRGIEAYGIDVSEFAISQVHESVADHCQVGSITDALPRRYDLIVSIEVLEHLQPAETPAAIAALCAASDRLLLSTSPDDFGEATHHNVRPPEDWAAELAGHGFFREVDHDVSYVTPWAGLYTRHEEPLPETVRRYDRSWTRQRREVDQLRGSLLAAEQQLAELEGESDERRPELLAKLDERDEEILRLRDLLIGMDAELGTARGRLTELEDRSQRLANAKLRVEEQIPVFGKLAGRLWTLIRGRRS